VFVTCDVFLILYIDLSSRHQRILMVSCASDHFLVQLCLFLRTTAWSPLETCQWQHWEDGWGTALPHGILLCPAPHLPKVYFHTSVSTANRNSPRFHSWARFDPFLQKSHWRVEVLHWLSESLCFLCVCSLTLLHSLSHVRLSKKVKVLFHKRFITVSHACCWNWNLFLYNIVQ